jgi:hypothetical protein
MTRTPWPLAVAIADALDLWPCGRDSLVLARDSYHHVAAVLSALEECRRLAQEDTERIKRKSA